MRIALLLCCCVSALCGCANQSGARMGLFSATSPVIAILADDLFVGEAEGYADKTGSITVTSALNPGVRCVGRFAYQGMRSGTGQMQCNDGHDAQFSFNGLSMLSGYGYGKSTRGPISFTFGLTLDESAEYLKLPQGKKLRQQEKGIELTPL